MNGKTSKFVEKYGEKVINFFMLCKRPALAAVFGLEDGTVIELIGNPVEVHELVEHNMLDIDGDVYPVWIVDQKVKYWFDRKVIDEMWTDEEMWSNTELLIRTLFQECIGWSEQIEEFVSA